MPPKKGKAHGKAAVATKATEVKVSAAAAAVNSAATTASAKAAPKQKGGKGNNKHWQNGSGSSTTTPSSTAATTSSSERKTKLVVPSLAPSHGDARLANWRDVGEAVRRLVAADSTLSGGNELWQQLPLGRIYRCGKIDYCTHEELHHARTIINLRMGDDTHDHKTVTYLQIAAANNVEKYDTRDSEVREWLTDVLNAIAGMDNDSHWPLIVHCRSGRDRTGVVVACLLTLLGLNESLIRAEYSLSEGTSMELISLTLDGWNAAKGLQPYFRRKVDLERVKRNLLGIYTNTTASSSTAATTTSSPSATSPTTSSVTPQPTRS